MTDPDGNVYKTIIIGTQTWMAENLRTTKYRNGEKIIEVPDNVAWGNLNTGAFCNYQNTRDIDTIDSLGRLYNWFAIADNRNIAPTGWHVASDDEWAMLTTYLGGEQIAGGRMKESGITHWPNPNIGATNESGFSALPSGNRGNSGPFGNFGLGFFWTSDQRNTTTALDSGLAYGTAECYRGNSADKHYGFSVRCIKD